MSQACVKSVGMSDRLAGAPGEQHAGVVTEQREVLLTAGQGLFWPSESADPH